MTQRFKCICDSEKDFKRNAQDINQRFKKIGYNHKTIYTAYDKAKCLTREQLLVQKQKQQQQCSDQVSFVTQYSRQANRIKQIIKRNWDILESDSSLREALPDASAIRFRRAPTLNDILYL